MTVINIDVRSTLSPDDVLRVLTDFSERRAEVWPGVDADSFTVHDQGDGFAEVTEGNSIGWERERYTWDATSGTVAAETLDSNLWASGSRWDYRITPVEGGTQIGVRLERHGKGIKGKLIQALIPVIGKKMITASLESALKPAQP
jgi:hypothetical protein